MKPELLAEYVTEAAAKYALRSTAPHMAILNLDVLWDNIVLRAYKGRGVTRFGAYVVLWDVARPFWSKERVLIEDLVIRVFDDDKSVTLQEVLTLHLPKIAEANGLKWIFTGDTQALGYMGEQYTKAGYTNLGSQFCKEIP